jgi:LacI family transcriptional regulator
MQTPLSSVDTNLELMGYRGAQLLDCLMRGKAAPKTPIRVPSSGVIVRKSSDLLAMSHQGVARCLRFIWEHAHEPISVKDLVSVAAMSRRSLHTAFLQNLGRPPGEEIHRVRIERAKKLLADPAKKIETVAGLCGYQSANSFWVSFKQATGVSPRQFREKVLR